MRKQLAFGKPLISYEPSVNHVTGIIAADFENYQCAFYNNFIDIEVAGAVDFYRLKDWQRYEMFTTCQIPKEYVSNFNNEQIVSLIKSWIDQERYLLISLETFYISNYQSYHSYNFCHYAMLMGYDDVKKTFICGDFFDFDHYTVEECLMDEVIDAIVHNDRTLGDFAKGFMLLKVDTQAKPVLDINRIAMSLHMLFTKNNPDVLKKYGLVIFDQICDMVQVGAVGESYIEFKRHAHFLVAHMEAMVMRIRYIGERSGDKRYSKLCYEIAGAKEEAEQYQNYILKLHVREETAFPEAKKGFYIARLQRIRQAYERSLKEFICLLGECKAFS